MRISDDESIYIWVWTQLGSKWGPLMGNLYSHRLGPSQGSICSETKLLYLAGSSCFLQWNSTKATLSVAAGETLFPSLACKCCSVSVKSPDISSWKNPNPCVRTELKYLPGQRQNGWTLVQSLLEGSLSSCAWKKRKREKSMHVKH